MNSLFKSAETVDNSQEHKTNDKDDEFKSNDKDDER